ncbi:MAG: thioredoxin family protein [Paludibacter sp.]|nr:thioredoxin family protein [Paludibacter sp.]
MKRTVQIIVLCFVVSLTSMAQKTSNVKIDELNSLSFKQKVWNYDKDKTFKRIGNLPIILDFHATWCGPCKMLAPHLQAIQNKYKGKLVIYKIDVDQSPQLAQIFNVEAMPTMIFMSNKGIKTELGYKEYGELENMVNTYFFKK